MSTQHYIFLPGLVINRIRLVNAGIRPKPATAYVQFAILLLLVNLCSAQVASTGLDQDPVFRTFLARRLAYPPEAERMGAYARIYAGFSIDPKGHVQNVTVLNPTLIGYGFEDQVLGQIRRLPAVNPRYEGQYALPVVFAFTNVEAGNKETTPAGSLPDLYLRGRTVLTEAKIVGYSKIERRRKTYMLWDKQQIR